jgi:starvation-inducible outer membrane lipoprotein
MSANLFLHCQQQHATALLICTDVMLAVCVSTPTNTKTASTPTNTNTVAQ